MSPTRGVLAICSDVSTMKGQTGSNITPEYDCSSDSGFPATGSFLALERAFAVNVPSERLSQVDATMRELSGDEGVRNA